MPLTGVINYVFCIYLLYSRVIADFVPNFVAMTTRVGPFKICLTSLDSLIPQTPC